jgi:hypothetical protein
VGGQEIFLRIGGPHPMPLRLLGGGLASRTSSWDGGALHAR